VAAGVLHTTPRYVFMPDDPALGEFRATFGGRPGTIEEYPLPGKDGAPGFAGAVEILSTKELWERQLSGDLRVDTAALIRARLFDLWIGDWDRHNKQWRWLRGASGAFEPLPEDRDQAFSKFGGLLLGTARATHPKFMDFEDRYGNFEGWMTQGTEVDRWLLSGAERAAFESAAEDLAARLTDAVIDDAVGRLPPEWYAIGGAGLSSALKKRRAALPGAAREFYGRLFRRVDIHGTDRDDIAHIARLEDGRLEVSLAASGRAPWFRRTYAPAETSEVRLYLYAGDDRVSSEGRADGPITLRVIGGAGDDALDDTRSGGTRFYDEEGGAVAAGPGTRVDRRSWVRRPAKPQETPWLEWRDWGARTVPQFQVWWEPDPGVMLAGGLRRQSWGFRKFPYASLQAVQLQYSTGRQAFKVNYDGEFRRENSRLYWVVDAQASQLENLNFFGFGNAPSDTPPEGADESYFDAESDTYRFRVWPRWSVSRTLELYAGPEVQWTRTPPDQDTFVGAAQPYGTGDFTQLGFRGGIDLDTRGHRLAGTMGDQFRSETKPALSGVRLKGEAFYYPKAGDPSASFGGLDGTLRGYLVGRRAMLAARVGGRRVWGDYPWFEAAFLGSSKSLRGYRKNRFAGDGSLYGSLEARWWLFRGRLIAPGRWGVFGLTDAGRVFLEGDPSDRWHASYGGGLFFQMLTLNTVFHAAAAHGEDGTRFYVDYGFAF
jgi:hypothetical protein